MPSEFTLDCVRIWPVGDGFSGPSDPRRVEMLARQAELMDQFSMRSNMKPRQQK
jgi:hypothetical protein